MTDTTPQLHVVTGAFGYTGKYITERLLAQGHRVRTLTGHPARQDPFGGRVEVAPWNFDRPNELRASLSGAAVLYNTYWVRFNRGHNTYDLAVANTSKLIQAAREAGVRKFVHVSISNPSINSSLPYFHGKAILEEALASSGLSFAILRPTVIFGKEDILVNNIAWFLRRWPAFAIPGRGDYRLQPVFVADLADLALRAANGANSVTDAVGPEIYTFEELVHIIAAAVRSRAKIVRVNPTAALAMTRVLGWIVGDVILTRDEIAGLMANLLVCPGAPTCPTSFRAWLEQHASTIGQVYASELARHFR